MSRPILFEYDAQRIIEEGTQAYHSTNRRVGWFLVGLVAVVAVCCVGAVLWSQVPYDAPAAMEGVR